MCRWDSPSCLVWWTPVIESTEVISTSFEPSSSHNTTLPVALCLIQMHKLSLCIAGWHVSPSLMYKRPTGLCPRLMRYAFPSASLGNEKRHVTVSVGAFFSHHVLKKKKEACVKSSFPPLLLLIPKYISDTETFFSLSPELNVSICWFLLANIIQ